MNTLSIISSLMFALIKGDGYGSSGPPAVPYGSIPISTVDLNCGAHSASLSIPLKGLGAIFFTPTNKLDIMYDIYIPDTTSITVVRGFGLSNVNFQGPGAVTITIPASATGGYGGYYTKGGYGISKPLRIPVTVTVNQPYGGKKPRRLASGSYGYGYKPAPSDPVIFIDMIKCTSKYAPPMAPIVTYVRGPVSTIDLHCGTHSGSLTIPLNGFGVIYFRPNGNNFQYTVTIPSGYQLNFERGFGLKNVGCNYYTSTCTISIPASAYSKSGAYRLPVIVTASKYSAPIRRLVSGGSYSPPAYTPPAYKPPPSVTVFISNIQCTKPKGY